MSLKVEGPGSAFRIWAGATRFAVDLRVIVYDHAIMLRGDTGIFTFGESLV
jgi:hypothetical protein